MSEHALTQVEDRLKVILEAYAPLSGNTVQIAESLDVAVDEEALPGIIITTIGYSVDVADENWSTIHTAIIDIQAATRLPATNTISRANRNTLANVVGAIAQDRTLGIKVHEIQETDVSPVEPHGKDVDAASLQLNVQFFTSRNDWFTIT